MGSRTSSITTEDNSKSSDQSHVYIKDKFQLEFLDCNCCCDTTKKIVNCDFQGINILRDLYEMVRQNYVLLSIKIFLIKIETPEYKLNCHCSCGGDDDNEKSKQSIKFGLTVTPNVDFTFNNNNDVSYPISSDSNLKQ